MQRPDLHEAAPEIVAYIEALEGEIEHLTRRRKSTASAAEPLQPAEPPTTLNVVTISARGLAKRTPRHLYQRQRRGGMGVFDLDSPADDAPAHLVVADEKNSLLLITSNARAFRFDLDLLPESPVRGRGQPLLARLGLQTGETLACALAADGEGYLLLVTDRGHVRRFAAHSLGTSMRPGAVLYDARQAGAPAAVCWSTGGDDLLIVTRAGKGVRFSEKQAPVRGCLGIRLDRDDAIAGATAVQEDSEVALVSADGRGAIRQMSGFRAFKSPGAAGKTIMKTEALVGAQTVNDQLDLFLISNLGKIIRFGASEIPSKTGVVQGVNCMELRADEVVAFTTSA